MNAKQDESRQGTRPLTRYLIPRPRRNSNGCFGPCAISPSSPNYKWRVAFTVTFSSFLVAMSQNSVQVALPPIMTAFGLNIDQAQWVITGYMIAGAMLVPTVGWLGNRTLYILSLLTFLAGSTLCAFAWSGPSLLVFRILQGLAVWAGRRYKRYCIAIRLNRQPLLPTRIVICW